MAKPKDPRNWMWTRSVQGIEYAFEVKNSVEKIFTMWVRRTGGAGGDEVAYEVPYEVLSNPMPFLQRAQMEFHLRAAEKAETERARRIAEADERFRREYREGLDPQPSGPVPAGSVGEPERCPEADAGEQAGEGSGRGEDRSAREGADREDSGASAGRVQAEPEAPARAPRPRRASRGRRKNAGSDSAADRERGTESAE